MSQLVLPSMRWYVRAAPLTLLLSTVMAALPPDPSSYKHTFVIVGGGLSGLSAALEASRQWEASYPGRPFAIRILEKEARLGGNSVKASSGINAIDVSKREEVAAFIEDTQRSGGGLSDVTLIETLVTQSTAAIGFLESFGVELSGRTRLGGHSTNRTRFNPAGANVGFAIMKQLMAAVEADPKIRVTTEATVTRIATGSDDNRRYEVHFAKSSCAPCCPVQHKSVCLGEGAVSARAVLLATGGFGANKTLLEEVAPKTAPYATTNGDGLDLGKQLGAWIVHLDQVQLHPTGFVDPKDPDAGAAALGAKDGAAEVFLGIGSKILAAEKLRGSGAIMLNREGRRFVDELNQRDHVVRALSKQSGEKAWLLLSAAGGEKYNVSHMGFYMGRGLLQKLETLELLSQQMEVPEATVRAELEAYNEGAETQNDAFGKVAFPTTFDLAGPFYLSMVTPVVHYTMGGLRINSQGQVLHREGQNVPIDGIYAAGEVSGGLHGKNRLGGNSLLDCVVFGRQAARHAVSVLAETNSHTEL